MHNNVRHNLLLVIITESSPSIKDQFECLMIHLIQFDLIQASVVISPYDFLTKHHYSIMIGIVASWDLEHYLLRF